MASSETARGRTLERVRDQQRDVAPTRAQGRHLDLDDRQAVVEIVAQDAAGLARANRLVAGAQDARAAHETLIAADALVAPVRQHAKELRLQRAVEITDLVEEERAAAGRLDPSRAARGGAREGAALVAEELALKQRRRQRGQVDRDERRRAARRVVVDGARDELLAGAGLAGDQHGRLGGSRPADELPDAEHRGAGADQPAPRGGERCRWRERLHQRSLLDRALDGGEQQREIERLGEVVERAVAHRLDGALAVPIRGGHDDGDVAVPARPQLAEQLEAVAVAQAEVEQHAVDRLRGDEPARFAETRRGHRTMAELGHRASEALAHARLVLDDENGDHATSRSRGSDSAKQVTSPVRV